jgi:chaperone modulatory protein CbpM
MQTEDFIPADDHKPVGDPIFPEDLIPAGEFCTWHRIEFSFISILHDSGLIGMINKEGTPFLSSQDLPDLEKFVRWHYELAINPEGIEALSHLLTRVNGLQEEIRYLRNKLQRYEGGPGNHDFADVD